jgi:hypothetical protein
VERIVSTRNVDDKRPDRDGVFRSWNGHDLPIAREPASEAERDGTGVTGIGPVHGLHVNVRLGAVAGVAAAPDFVSNGEGLTDGDLDAAVLEVAEGDEGSAAHLDDHVIACQPPPPPTDTLPLGQGVTDRRDPSE